jgi:transcriptional regulator with XRE-family HTH domain
MHENRVYIPEPTLLAGFESRLMPKYAPPTEEGFATRLARLRKAAGFTQQQLAAEIGISRRRIAYYEAESDHPPASLLPKLARALNTTVDELLGAEPLKRKARPASLSPRLERRLRQIESLSPKPKQQLLSIIDTFIAAEQNRRGS